MKVYDHNLIKKFKIPAKQVTTLDKDVLQRLINSMEEHTLSKLRLKTAVICLISSGCRVSELLKLNISDVDFQTGKAQVADKFLLFSQACQKKTSVVRNRNCWQ